LWSVSEADLSSCPITRAALTPGESGTEGGMGKGLGKREKKKKSRSKKEKKCSHSAQCIAAPWTRQEQMWSVSPAGSILPPSAPGGCSAAGGCCQRAARGEGLQGDGECWRPWGARLLVMHWGSRALGCLVPMFWCWRNPWESKELRTQRWPFLLLRRQQGWCLGSSGGGA